MLILLLLAATDPLLYESEQAWYRQLRDVAPGRPGAAEVLEGWLARYTPTGSVRVAAAEELLWAHRYGSDRDVLRAWERAGRPLDDLPRPRPPRTPRGGGGGIDVELRPYAQVAFAPSVAVPPPIVPTLGGTGFFGFAYEPFDLEGVWGLGVTATTGEPVGFELATGVGGDGVLGWLGVGVGRGGALHQYVQVELTTDGDQPWPVLGARLQAEEDPFGDDPPALRGMLLAGFKLGETPD